MKLTIPMVGKNACKSPWETCWEIRPCPELESIAM